MFTLVAGKKISDSGYKMDTFLAVEKKRRKNFVNGL